MDWWRTFLLVVSLVLAGPVPVTSALAAAAAPQTIEAEEPCHHDAAPDPGAPACCDGQDMATHCGTAACATSCTVLLGLPAAPLPHFVPTRAGARAELPVPRGRSVAPEEPPPTA